MKKEENMNQKLANLLSGTNTEQQKKEVEEWIKQSKGNSFQYDELQKLWKERTPDPKLINHDSVKSKLWSSIQTELEESSSLNQKQFRNWKFWKVAAILLLLIVPTILLIFRGDLNSENNELPAKRMVIKQNPSGQKSQIQLPDGSKAWLNADSKISFVEDFSDSVRAIRLEGEAYFEVMHDSLYPFIVHTDKLTISVLGTGFNVSAYNNENDIIVALIHGSVKVQMNNPTESTDILLSPGKGMTYSKEHNDYQDFYLMDNEFLYKRITSWKDGILVFDGQDFNAFIKEISRWYGLNVIIYGVPPENWHVRASFENENLNNILDAISFNKEFSYELNNRELKLMFN